MPPPACMTGQTEKVLGNKTFEKRLVTIFSYHDESSFHANEGQTWQWAEGEKQILHPKRVNMGLRLANALKSMVPKSESCYKTCRIQHSVSQNILLFLFDQSSGHCAYAEDALIVSRMNVSDGGKQPFEKYKMGWRR